MAAHSFTSPSPFEYRKATAAVHVTSRVGLIAERVKPTSTVPARRLPSFFSFSFQKAKRTPSASSTTAVTPCEMGTTTGWRARIVVNPKKATPA